MSIEWGDHFEHRLTLAHLPDCKGIPVYDGAQDQGIYCADGCISFSDGDFHLPLGKLAEFVSTLYEAAGRPAPVVLDQPFRSLFGKCYFGPDFYVRQEGPAVIVGLGDAEVTIRGPHALGAYLVLAGDKADAAAEEAEVEELAAAIRAELYPPSESIGLRPSEADRTAAQCGPHVNRAQRRVLAAKLRDAGCTLKQIGGLFGVTREMIRQDLLPPRTPGQPRLSREAKVRAAIAEQIARAIEQSACAPGDQCADRFCPDCVRYHQTRADAATARRIGGQP